MYAISEYQKSAKFITLIYNLDFQLIFISVIHISTLLIYSVSKFITLAFLRLYEKTVIYFRRTIIYNLDHKNILKTFFESRQEL